MSASQDVIVVGNGVLGYSVAHSLLTKDPSLRISVVGLPSRPFGASSAAGAMLGCFGEVTASLLRSTYGRAKLAMGIQATSLWPEWLEQLNALVPAAERLTIRPGTFVVANARSGTLEDENFGAIREAAERSGADWQEVDPRDIPGLEPESTGRPLRSIFLPGEGSVDSGKLLAALQAALEASGRVSFVHEVASALTVGHGRLEGVRLAGGEVLGAPRVVLTGGVGTQQLLDSVPELARRIPRLVQGNGCSLVLETDFDAPQQVIRTPNRAFACGLHMVPRGERRVYVGATYNIGYRDIDVGSPEQQDAHRPRANDMHFLLAGAMEQFNHRLESARLVSWHTGSRPVTMDTCPLIGGTSLAGLWIATGTYRDGLHLSPLLSRHMANLVLGAPGLFENPFPPERKLISLRTKEQAIEDTVKHQVSVGWEHGLKLPKTGWQDMLHHLTHEATRSVYDALDGDFVLPIEFVAAVMAYPDTMIPFFRAQVAHTAGGQDA